MKKITALLVASTLALGAANLAYAADTTPDAGAKMDAPHKHHKGGPKGGHDNMFKGLNLTDAQKQQIRDMRPEHPDRMMKKGEWQDERRAMHDLIASDHFDKNKAQAHVDKMAEQQKARMMSHLEMQNKIYNILTPEQKKQFNEKFEKQMTERAKHHAEMVKQK